MDYKFNERRSGLKSISEPYRTESEIDKARIIHSEAFRRLQSKTQVLQTSESDFHRNRLTHSVEVSQIGKGISRYIDYTYKTELDMQKLSLDHDLIEAICLAHDIGHPPFGHGGEIALNYMMRDHGGFEGNGQTLRIISKQGKYSEGHGMDLTRRTCLGVLKYPCSFSELWNTSKKRTVIDKFHELDQDEWMPPKSYFDDEKEVVDWIMESFSKQDQATFRQYNHNKSENHNSKFKSFDCSIMNLADDISYSVHDFEDGLELGVFTGDLVDTLIEQVFKNEKYQHYLKKIKKYDKLSIDKLKTLAAPKKFISVTIGFLIHNAELAKNEAQFECPYLQYTVRLTPEAKEILDLFGKIVWDNIIMSPHSQQLVKNGQIIVCSLFDVFLKNKILLPKHTQENFDDAKNKHRVICDYISGMSDRYALKMYSKIFGSEIVSFFEK